MADAAGEVTLLGVRDIGGCRFACDFDLEFPGSTTRSGVKLDDRIILDIHPKCHKRFILNPARIFGNTCDFPDADPDPAAVKAYVDSVPTISQEYIFACTLQRRGEDGDCLVLVFEWMCWRVSSTTPVNPYVAEGDLDLNAGFGTVKGKVKGKLYQAPLFSGPIRIKVCCEKVGETDCSSVCSYVK